MNIDFTVCSRRFHKWIGTDSVFEKYKDKIYETDEWNFEMSIVDFDEDAISLVVNDYIKELNASESETFRISFDAGVQLSVENIRIGYNCCGEFCNYKEWERILSEKETKWTEIWIGHPWIYYKIADNMILFSEYSETNDTTNLKELIRIEFKEFEEKLKDLLEKINIFKDKIKCFIGKNYPENSEYFYNQMIEGI